MIVEVMIGGICGARGNVGGWRILRGLLGGEDIRVGALKDEEEFTRELEKGIPGKGNILCSLSWQERATHVLSHPSGPVGWSLAAAGTDVSVHLLLVSLRG